MTDEPDKPKSRRGFASMSLEKRRGIAALGGASVPRHKRSFSKDRDLAQLAGQKGGLASVNKPRKRKPKIDL